MSKSAAPPASRRPIQIVIGVVLVLIAFVGVLLAGRLAGGGSAAKASVIAAAHDLPVGRLLTADDLTVVQVDVAPTGAITDKSLAVGKITRQAIPANQPLVDSALAAPAVQAAAKLYFVIPAGFVALNIPAADISPYVQPGDQIDVIASLKGGTAGNQTKATLKGLKVISVGTPGTPTAGNLVVEVTLQDAEELQFLVKNTDFTYVLKSPLDASVADPSTQGVDLSAFKVKFGFR